MELNGSLHEFILADVFQLLAQQKASGRLEVHNGDKMGYMILMQGSIISAQEVDDNLQRKLANALRTLRRLPEKEIDKLFGAQTTGVTKLCAELSARQIVTEAELTTIARATLEDIACSLFRWSRGTYRFVSMDLVKQYLVPGVMLPADSVVMEAMRRDDESKRQYSQMTDDIIFVATSREHGLGAIPKDLGALFSNPDAYVLSFVDGLTSIGSIAERSCLGRFRIHESLHRLKEGGAVAPLSSKLSQSIQAAMNKSEAPDAARSRSLALTVAGSLLAALVVVFLGYVVFRGVIMRSKLTQSAQVRTNIETGEAKEKALIAVLQYWAATGNQSVTYDELVRAGYLRPQDVPPAQAPVRKQKP